MPRPHLRDPKLEQSWRTALAKWTASGLNVRDFCRRHRLAESAFYFWRREIAARDRTPVPAPTSEATSAAPRRSPAPQRPTRAAPARRSSRPTPRPRFVALRVVPDAPLELVLRTGHVLRVPPGYDADHLRAVAAALEAHPC
jgi:hypothetical protein